MFTPRRQPAKTARNLSMLQDVCNISAAGLQLQPFAFPVLLLGPTCLATSGSFNPQPRVKGRAKMKVKNSLGVGCLEVGLHWARVVPARVVFATWRTSRPSASWTVPRMARSGGPFVAVIDGCIHPGAVSCSSATCSPVDELAELPPSFRFKPGEVQGIVTHSIHPFAHPPIRLSAHPPIRPFAHPHCQDA